MRNLAGGGVSPPTSAVRAASFDRRVGSLSGPAADGHRGPQPGLPISPVPRGPGPAVPPMPSMLVAVGVLQH